MKKKKKNKVAGHSFNAILNISWLTASFKTRFYGSKEDALLTETISLHDILLLLKRW